MRICAFVVLLAYSSSCFSHSGGLNAEGCHHETATGGYHCHNGSSSSTSPDEASASTGEILGILLGSIVVIWLIHKVIDKNNIEEVTEPNESRLTVSPTIENNDVGLEFSYKY